MEKPLEGCLSIGQVLRPQGLKGQVKVRPDTDDAGRVSGLRAALIRSGDGQTLSVPLHDISVRGGFVYLTLNGDDSVEAAEKRRGLTLYVLRRDAVPLGRNENYITDLIGCEMVDTDGKRIGTLTDVLQPGANDVYVVKTSEGDLLVPALLHVILEVDILRRVVLADAQRLMEVSILAD